MFTVSYLHMVLQTFPVDPRQTTLTRIQRNPVYPQMDQKVAHLAFNNSNTEETICIEQITQ